MQKHWILAAAVSFVLFAHTAACGGASTATTTARANEGAARDDGRAERTASRALSRHELAKLDDRLRERVEADAASDVFPVRVKFVSSRPSRDELTALLLAPYERDAIGRVDRATLKTIAGRSDVRMISFVDDGAGY